MQIEKYKGFKAELAIAETFAQIKLIENRAAAVAEFGKRDKVGKTEQNEWGKFRVEIEVKKGEWLNKNFPQGVKKKFKSCNSGNSSMKEEGINEHESSNARLVAKETELVSEAMKEIEKSNKVITPGAVTAQVRKKKKAKAKKQKEKEIKEKAKNYHNTDNFILLEGDLFNVIEKVPDNSIDLLCTDPPYFILDEQWDAFKDKEHFFDFTESWLKAVMPKMKDTGRIYISFAHDYQFDFYEIIKRNNYFGFNFGNLLIWYYKNNNKPFYRKRYRFTYEPIFYLYGKKAPILNFSPDTFGEMQQNVWEIATPQSNYNEGKFHVSQKPLELYRRIIKTGSFDGNTVLDCFAGSGTTGIVCKELDRNCILIEKDTENIKLIKGRI